MLQYSCAAWLTICCIPSFAVRPVNDFRRPVFFLRHGESEFNAAGLSSKFSSSLTDAPLTKRGIEQATLVASQLQQGHEMPEMQDLLQADCIFASPLTRAVQTALIALKPLLRQGKILKLLPDAREAVDCCHWDSVGAAVGDNITARALRLLGAREAEELQNVTVDSSLATSKWWADRSESSSMVKARLRRMLEMLLGSQECNSIIVVGHSTAIKEMFQLAWNPENMSYIPSWYRGSVQEFQHSLRNGATPLPLDPSSKKVTNLGLVGAKLKEGPSLTEARLLLDTGLVGMEEKRCADGLGVWVAEDGQTKRRNGRHRNHCACGFGLHCAGSCDHSMNDWKYKFAQVNVTTLKEVNHVFHESCTDCKCA